MPALVVPDLKIGINALLAGEMTLFQLFIDKLEFHRTHTLCALSTVSTDCTCSDIVVLHPGLHCSCNVGILHSHSCIACRQGVAYLNTIFWNPFLSR